MLKTNEIIDEIDPILRQKSEEVTFPLSENEKETIQLMLEYLRNSQIPDLAEQYDLRPGMGMAAVQVGLLKRIFVVVHEFDDGEFEEYVIINPKIISNSEEQIFVEEGEGCLSVNRDVDGIIPRYARVTLEAYNEDGDKILIRGREELAVVFQHEIDHLNGILFFDHIDVHNPYKGSDLYRGI